MMNAKRSVLVLSEDKHADYVLGVLPGRDIYTTYEYMSIPCIIK